MGDTFEMPSLDFSRERLTFMFVAFLAHEVPLFAYQFVCGWLHQRGLCREYLIQPDAYPPPSLIEKCTRQILVGHLVVQWIFLYFISQGFNFLGIAPLSAPWNPMELLYVFPFMVICDTLLYWAHRTLHHPQLYARFHKQHHEFHSNIPLASEYFSPLEEVFTGFIPTLTGPLLFRPHTLTILLWVAFRVCESADAHCGYDFPFSIFRLGRPGDRHDFHHSKNVGNYSAFFCFWDKICGTDAHYLEYRKKKLATKKD